MSKIVTSGSRVLKGDAWHDANGLIPDGEWDPSMTDEEIEIAALSDPDCLPTPPEQLAKMRRIAPARFIRQQLGMSIETFAIDFDIPLDTLRAWELHHAEPTPVELAYLRAIQRAPDAVRKPGIAA